MNRFKMMNVAGAFLFATMIGCGADTPSQSEPAATDVPASVPDGSGTTGDVAMPEQPAGGSGSK
ncbi:hypothetical protein [Rhodopirellula sp. SWK7]|uniref:hypothetical protein n=1 Tax=Rhodopirellula sp. SWK7 TaxID=595460 RepID=UPI00118188A9|nr:hypothetical protein [Rhodopirellula sp. SWK7]